MMDFNAKRAELTDLLSRMCDAELDRADWLRLESLLLDDPVAQDFYHRFVGIDVDLAWRADKGAGGRVPLAESRVESPELSVESESLRPEAQDLRPDFPVINLQISKSPNPQIPISALRPWAFSYAAATLLLAIAMLGAWSYTIVHSDADALAKHGRTPTPSADTEKAPSEFTFVGHVGGMVDCQWADPKTETYPGAGMALGRRYALKSGLMELIYKSGAKVILQGPCDYTVESARAGFLKIGKLVARMGAGGGGRGAGETTNLPSPFGRGVGGEGSQSHSQSALTLTLSQRERGQNLSPTPHAPRPSPLFAVRTPTALVEDLGTEFGVEVLDNGETASHVFQGQVVVKIEGTGDENPKSAIQHPKSLVLSAGQSARVAGGAEGNAIERLAGEQAQPKFARRLLETPAELDLLDIVCGGNGAGHRREMGIDQSTGGRRTVISSDWRRGDRRYWPVSGMGLIDGVFVPGGPLCAVQLDSAGHVCDVLPESYGGAFGLIWARAAEVAKKDRGLCWVHVLANAEKFMPRQKGLLAFHASAGITFDLEVVRKIYRDARPVEFHAVIGLGDPRPFSASADGNADFWVFVDGQEKFKRTELRQADGAVEVRVELGAKDRFLTLVATDAGDGNKDDCMVVGDPVIKLDPIEPAARKEGR